MIFIIHTLFQTMGFRVRGDEFKIHIEGGAGYGADENELPPLRLSLQQAEATELSDSPPTQQRVISLLSIVNLFMGIVNTWAPIS